MQCSDATQGDAYARFDEPAKTWSIGTSMVEEKIQFSGGTFALIGFQNRLSQRQYITGASQGEEFRITVDGTVYTGASKGWVWKGGETKVLEQGEIQLSVRLENKLLRVEKTYVAYPGTSIIRQWVVYQNITSRSLKISNPYFLANRLRAQETDKLMLNYMTGGGFFTGSQVLKQVPLNKTYARTFDTKAMPLMAAYAPFLDMTDTTDNAENALTIDGINLNLGYAHPYGSGAYMPWFCIRDAQAEEGVFVGFDYLGRWLAEIGNYYGGPGYIGLGIGGYKKELAPGESLRMPTAFTGVFAGDLDSMGNQLKFWQYRYLWDYTSDDYFSKIRLASAMRVQSGKGESAWGGGTQDNWDYRMAAILHVIDVMRYVGADILWQDAGWHDYMGDWDGPDFSEVNRYLSKSGMRLTVWMPAYTAEPGSRTYREHPDWCTFEPVHNFIVLDTSRNDVVGYLSNLLEDKIAKWGDFQWRLDFLPLWPVRKDETPMLAQYHNFMGLMSTFRRRHPASSIDITADGSNLVGFETLRVSDVGQLTDGGTLFVSNYYSSYLFPPDKIFDWTRVSNFTWENARSVLTMAATWAGDRGLDGQEPGLLLNDGLENQRRNFEIYHYLVQQGVAGRWSLVYHPKVEGDDPVYYFQRLSQDGKRGAIILKHFVQGEARIFPKGLDPQATYDVRFEMSKQVASRTGADLMKSGITLLDPCPGELVYLGLPNIPGGGADHTPPSDPSNVLKRLGTNMGVTGVELAWAPSTDNNWLSYYQIYRDGELIDKVARGTYYFDHSGGPENISARYEVQAIDGDGNGSSKVEASEATRELPVYTAHGGFLAGKDYSYQGANGWSYEEWLGTNHSDMTWDGALAQMGLYKGSAGTGPQNSVIGASWMRPGEGAEAVRVFTLPYSGEVTITGTVHKDIYHTYGDGVRVMVLKNSEQLWPQNGWEMIGATDTSGKSVAVKVAVRKGDKLYFVVDAKGDSVDDDTVWDPQIAYERIDGTMKVKQYSIVDDQSSLVRYEGPGWQMLGVGESNGNDRDHGYLTGRIKGTLAVSGTAGDKMILKFRGTGVELVGATGSDHGIARIIVDGKQVAIVDTFAPEQSIDFTTPTAVREATSWPINPPIKLWGIRNMDNAEHTLELDVTAQKNSASTGTFIAVDALVVLDGVAITASK